MNKKYVLETRNIVRSGTDAYWEIIESESLKTWKSMQKNFGRISFQIDSEKYTIRCDPTNILYHVRDHIAIMKNIQHESDPEKYFEHASRFPGLSNAYLPIEIEAHEGQTHHLETVAWAYVYELFVVMNLASPGSCDLYGTRMNNGSKPIHHSHGFELSNLAFEVAAVNSHDGYWPKVQYVPLADVVHWYKSVRSFGKQIPENATEKAIFALLHICDDGLSPMSIVWIFFALEAIYDTHPGTNKSALRRRVSKLLEPDPKEEKYLHKQLNLMYDLRSSIVHGNYRVNHPYHNEVLDSRVLENYQKVQNAQEFGIRLVIASIQKLIVKKWSAINFEEFMIASKLGNHDPF